MPTDVERTGDFSQSGVTIYDPNTTAASPTGGSVRMPFADNVIPLSRINSAAYKMLAKYTPAQNQDNGMMAGMAMMGTPSVFGQSGLDSNNLMDVHTGTAFLCGNGLRSAQRTAFIH